jgi:hypothetical protein
VTSFCSLGVISSSDCEICDIRGSLFFSHAEEFKVHSKDSGYFQSQIITFIVDKDDVLEYNCSIHPEIRGKVVFI